MVDLGELERGVGHTFRNRELLVRALTHKSLLAESPAPQGVEQDNEQLEFLGDAVLGYLASDFLVRLAPAAREGMLSRMKSHLVSAAHLYETAVQLGLGDHLRLGRGEELSGGREKRALLANALEALIAALYLDGGLEVSRDFVERHILLPARFQDNGTLSLEPDPKSALQELAQSLKLPVPRYVLVREQGPEHAKTFTVEARVGKAFSAQAEGSSKKAASQKAAKQVLDQMRRGDPFSGDSAPPSG